MKIGICALGSRGDVQPCVALGAGLRAAGHTVRLLASADFRELVASHGLEFIAIGGSHEAIARELQHLVERGRTPRVFSRQARLAERQAHGAAALPRPSDSMSSSRPIARRHLSVDSLGEAIRIATTDSQMRSKAADRGERIRAEDGVARAAAVIERHGRQQGE